MIGHVENPFTQERRNQSELGIKFSRKRSKKFTQFIHVKYRKQMKD